MATIRETIEQKLNECGMFDDAIQAVVEATIADPVNDAMAERWNEDVADYPAIITALAWCSAKKHALKWIDENAPLAWFRPLFAN